MTADKARKKAIRQLMQTANIPYSEAKTRLENLKPGESLVGFAAASGRLDWPTDAGELIGHEFRHDSVNGIELITTVRGAPEHGPESDDLRLVTYDADDDELGLVTSANVEAPLCGDKSGQTRVEDLTLEDIYDPAVVESLSSYLSDVWKNEKPIYLDATQWDSESDEPSFLVAGASGAGKTELTFGTDAHGDPVSWSSSDAKHLLVMSPDPDALLDACRALVRSADECGWEFEAFDVRQNNADRLWILADLLDNRSAESSPMLALVDVPAELRRVGNEFAEALDTIAKRGPAVGVRLAVVSGPHAPSRGVKKWSKHLWDHSNRLLMGPVDRLTMRAWSINPNQEVLPDANGSAVYETPSKAVAVEIDREPEPVGDSQGALIGHTVNGNLPARLDWAEGARRLRPACTVITGSAGSGKTRLGLSLARQTAESAPTIFIELHPQERLEADVTKAGGDIFSLDNVAEAGGSLDPLRVFGSPELGVQLAAQMIESANPFGSLANRADADPWLHSALVYGIGHGARSTGSALSVAARDEYFPKKYWRDVERQLINPWFRALIGFDDDPDTDVLSFLRTGGLTLVQPGRKNLDLPDPGQVAPPNLEQRIGLALVRALTYACTSAVAAQGGGSVFLDEAHLFLYAGLPEMEKLARLGRSMNVAVFLLMREPSDIAGANFEDHLCRVLTLHSVNSREAHAACELAGIDPTPERIAQISRQGRDNVNTLRLIHGTGTDPKTGKRVVTRGPVALYTDLDQRTAAVEIPIENG